MASSTIEKSLRGVQIHVRGRYGEGGEREGERLR